ncbi:peptidyl-tRNA hydrolase isoform X2 [Antennarius striatus]|uniref:peptidyl-tRNA hydrolase isoform X2 n=1 Tax=Antennarius striatus TaxID=241820 RepID=UPI0035B37857
MVPQESFRTPVRLSQPVFGATLSWFFSAGGHWCHAAFELLNSVTMRRLLTRAINRFLLGELFSTRMGIQAEINTHSPRRLVVGLGNPGMENTRHSVGMAVLGLLAARLGMSDCWKGDKYVSGEVIVSEVKDTKVVLLRSKLPMNINGVSVAKAAGKYGIKPEDILLVHDELDKPLGKIAIKHGGSARGHNGVRSCVDLLQTDVMHRLRVGIGRPASRTSVDRYVLQRFSPEEQKVLGAVLSQSVDLLLSQLSPQESSQVCKSPSSPAGGRRKSQTVKETSASLVEDSTAVRDEASELRQKEKS